MILDNIYSSDCCFRGTSWLGPIAGANDMHPVVECSNRGRCDRKTGACVCVDNYEGLACERISCPNDCSFRGICMSQSQMAEEAGRVYSSPWDAEKIWGCVCDIGYRGPDCSLFECPSGPGK